jgi:guanine deaminase
MNVGRRAMANTYGAAIETPGGGDGVKRKQREEWMRQAIALAVENVRCGGGPFGAVVAKGDRVIATGVNSVTATNDPTAHAEVNAIRAACQAIGDYQLEGCEIYTSCEPCPMCLGAIYWARPKLYYFSSTRSDAAEVGFDDAFIYRELRIAQERRSIPGRRLLPEAGWMPFAEWNRNANKIRY